MKHGIDYDRNNPLQQRILPLIPTHVSNPISSLKFIGKSTLEGAGFAPTTSFQAFKLIVAFVFIASFLHSEGAQFALATLQTFVDKDQAALQSVATKLIIEYSKISFHFCKDCRIFCEGEWEEQSQQSKYDLVDHYGVIGRADLIDLIKFVSYNGLINCNGLVDFIGVVIFFGLDRLIGLAGLIDDIRLIGPSGHNGLVGFMGLGLVGLIGFGCVSLIG
mgnify:CR=1 FL=1